MLCFIAAAVTSPYRKPLAVFSFFNGRIDYECIFLLGSIVV